MPLLADTLDDIAQAAKIFYEYMRDSGLYTAAQVATAYEAAQNARPYPQAHPPAQPMPMSGYANNVFSQNTHSWYFDYYSQAEIYLNNEDLATFTSAQPGVAAELPAVRPRRAIDLRLGEED